MKVNLPLEAKPHEAAILYVYAIGIRRSQDIAKQLHYSTPRPVQKVLKKYKKILSGLRQTSRRAQIISGNFMVSP